jgi:hypothetical protein
MTFSRLPIPLYPTGIAIASVLYLYAVVSVSPFAALRTFVVVTAISLLVTWLMVWLTGDRDVGGLLSIAVTLAVLAGQQPITVFGAALAIVAIIVAHRAGISRSSRMLPAITRGLTLVVAIALVATGLLALQEGRVHDSLHDFADEARLSIPAAGLAVASGPDRPDMYIILLDGYMRPDKQAGWIGRDGAAFVRALEARGFDVADRSRSNAIYTHLSLPSMFEMRPPGDIWTGKATWRSARSIMQSRTISGLREAGYEIVTVAPGWDELSLRGADRALDTGQVSDFELSYLDATGLGRTVSSIYPGWWPASIRGRIEDNLAVAITEAGRRSSRPRFVFVHVPAPHPPFVFGAGGESRSPAGSLTAYYPLAPDAARSAFLRDYGDQLTHINALVLDTIDGMLAAADSPPVILVMSDHGSRSAFEFAFDIDDEAVDEGSANLVALYSPGRASVLPEDVTLVNVMGPLLHTYLGIDALPQRESVFVEHEDGLTEWPRPRD